MGVCRCSGPMERRLRADGVPVARVCRNTRQKGAALESKHVQTELEADGARIDHSTTGVFQRLWSKMRLSLEWERGLDGELFQKASESREKRRILPNSG